MPVFLALAVSACTTRSGLLDDFAATVAPSFSHGADDRECMARAMYFESHRSSREGMIAVGTVVMNRVQSDQFPDTVCEVVAQKGQFAPGIMSRQMSSAALPDVMAAADAVLKGERHPKVGKAMYFHQAGLSFPYGNMHYVLEAGGNAFYHRVSRAERKLMEMAEGRSEE
jgi:spore germination cell wall hydrolase CwlJ-like protein